MPKRHNPSHTLLGIPGAKKGEKGEENSEEDGDDKEVSVNEEEGGSTMFGMGNRRTSGPLGGRKPSGKGVRQTLMGLGSVRLLNEPSENADRPFDADEDGKKQAKPKVGSRSGGNRGVRSTMTGLPGVEVGNNKKSSGRPKLPGRSGKKGSAAARSTMMGMPAITDDSSQKPKLSTDKLSLKSPGKPRGKTQENSEPTVSISDDHIQKARKLAKKFDKPSAEQPDAKAGGEEEEFDPLAGFAGVTEPKVSSLMDEEVEDLSAQVFGDGFAFGDEELDFEEEEDDFDFEFASAPVQPSGQAGTGDIPEEDVHHDIEAAEAALADMMLDLEDVMPDEDEAAEALGLDEDKAAAALAEEESASDSDPDGPTIADANVKEMMAEVRAEETPPPAPPQAAKAQPKPRAPEPAATKPGKKKAPAPRKAAPAAGTGFGLGGIMAVLGGLASVAWLFIPVEGASVISAIASLDVASQVLVVFSVVAAILAVVTALMKLPGGSKGLVLGVLGIGLGALSFSAPVLTAPLNFPVYAATGLFVLAGVFYAFAGKKS